MIFFALSLHCGIYLYQRKKNDTILRSQNSLKINFKDGEALEKEIKKLLKYEDFIKEKNVSYIRYRLFKEFLFCMRACELSHPAKLWFLK